jgi:predicted RNA-binding Zn-ribbon protein involved in translation (DUF1610 family)
MKNVYGCPHCETVLNPSVKILLVAKYNKKKGMILLSPQPGNFKFICDRSLENNIKPGATVTFYCPVCGTDLTSPDNRKFARLILIAPNGRQQKVEFSRVYGTHATFIIDGDEVTAYGDDAEDFNPPNFFGL